MVALDVGANVGAYSMLLGRWVGPAGRVFAFEPAPRAFDGLSRHCASIISSRSSRPSVRPWARRRRQAGCSSPARRGRAGWPARRRPATRRPVAVTTIDDFCAREGVRPTSSRSTSKAPSSTSCAAPREVIAGATRCAGPVRRDAPVDLAHGGPDASPTAGRTRARSGSTSSRSCRPTIPGRSKACACGWWRARPMRILIANDGFGDAGGVQTYLDAVIAGLHRARPRPRDPAPRRGAGAVRRRRDAVARAVPRRRPRRRRRRRRRPPLAPGRLLLAQHEHCSTWTAGFSGVAPVVKFMHGYFGTCVSGQKRFGVPGRASVRPPLRSRVRGAVLSPPLRAARPGEARHAVPVGRRSSTRSFGEYRALVVASEHMKREYVRNGVGRCARAREPALSDRGRRSPRRPPAPPPSRPSRSRRA